MRTLIIILFLTSCGGSESPQEVKFDAKAYLQYKLDRVSVVDNKFIVH